MAKSHTESAGGELDRWIEDFNLRLRKRSVARSKTLVGWASRTIIDQSTFFDKETGRLRSVDPGAPIPDGLLPLSPRQDLDRWLLRAVLDFPDLIDRQIDRNDLIRYFVRNLMDKRFSVSVRDRLSWVEGHCAYADPEGLQDTPLLAAIRMGCLDAVAKLCPMSSLDVTDKDGLTASELARSRGHLDIASFIDSEASRHALDAALPSAVADRPGHANRRL